MILLVFWKLSYSLVIEQPKFQIEAEKKNKRGKVKSDTVYRYYIATIFIEI